MYRDILHLETRMSHATMSVRLVQMSCDTAALKPGHVLASMTDDLVCSNPVPTKIMHYNLQGHI